MVEAAGLLLFELAPLSDNGDAVERMVVIFSSAALMLLVLLLLSVLLMPLLFVMDDALLLSIAVWTSLLPPFAEEDDNGCLFSLSRNSSCTAELERLRISLRSPSF